MEQTEKKNKKVNSSIIYRLNARLFANLLSVFILLNVILTVLFLVGLIFTIQNNVDKATEYLDSKGGVEALEKNQEALEFYDFEVKTKKEERYLFSQTAHNRNLNQWISSINVNLEGMLNDGTTIYFKKNIGDELKGFFTLLLIFAGFQLIMLLSESFKNQKIVRRTFEPLDELARTANVLNAASDMSPDALKKLAGTLDEINANHLDTRIPISSAKKELKSLAMAINGMLDRIDGAYKSQMRFVSDASHELRTPIAVIEGYANLLDRWGKEDPEAMQEAINAIKSESKAMKEMVEQLLFLARGDNESMHFEIENIHLVELASETTSEIKMIDKNHIFIENFEQENEDEKSIISGDSGLIKQLMRILIDNSIKYTPDGKTIKITVKSAGNYVNLVVQDEGMGIEADSLSNIFERFYRTDESRARQTGGTGLGLSIAKWIVDKHGGTLEVVSRKEIGTRITVSFERALEICCAEEGGVVE